MWIGIGILALVVVLGLAGFYLLRSRDEEDDEVYHFICPACKGKMRYHKRQAGRAAVCLKCRNKCTLPPVAGK